MDRISTKTFSKRVSGEIKQFSGSLGRKDSQSKMMWKKDIVWGGGGGRDRVPGSLSAKQPILSPLAKGEIHFCFCSSDPNFRIGPK